MSQQAPPLDLEFIDRFRHPVSHGNAVRDMNPLIVLVILVLLGVMAGFLPFVTGPIAICAATVLIAIVAGIGTSYTVTYLKLFAVVGVLLFVIRVVFPTDTDNALWEWGPFAVTVDGIASAADFTFLVMAVCGIFTLFFTWVSVRNLMLAMERAGASHKASYVALASFQAITDLGVNTRTVLDAQKARGIETEGSIVKRIGAFFPVLTPVFLSAMTSTEERSLALDARAFNAPTVHSQLAFLGRTRAWEWVVLAVVVIATAFVITGKVLLWH